MTETIKAKVTFILHFCIIFSVLPFAVQNFTTVFVTGWEWVVKSPPHDSLISHATYLNLKFLPYNLVW